MNKIICQLDEYSDVVCVFTPAFKVGRKDEVDFAALLTSPHASNTAVPGLLHENDSLHFAQRRTDNYLQLNVAQTKALVISSSNTPPSQPVSRPGQQLQGSWTPCRR